MGSSVCRASQRYMDGSEVAPNNSLSISSNPTLPRCLVQLKPNRPPIAVCHLLPNDPNCNVFDGFPAIFSASKFYKANKPDREAADQEDMVRKVFFFHGVGGSCDVFFFQIGYLLRLGYEVIAMDLPGHGRSPASSTSSDYSFESLWLDALTLFDRFASTGKSNAVIGHSYGTAFAARLCVERSKRVSRAVLVSGGGPSALGGAPICLRAVTCCCCCCCCCCFCGYGGAFLRCLVSRLAFAPRSQPPLGRRSSPALLEAPPNVLAWTLLGQDWREGDADYHRAVAAPVLLMHGCQDRLVSLEDEEWMLETLPLARLVRIPNAGHLLTLEAPETVNSHLGHFLRSASPVGHGRVPPLPAPSLSAGHQEEQRRRSQRSQRRRERRDSREVEGPSVVNQIPDVVLTECGGFDNAALEL